MKLYICGAMTGLPEFNFPAFSAAAKALIEAGFPVLNPVDINPNPGTPWKDCMRRDIILMLQECGGVAVLPITNGLWYNSRGANLEIQIATSLEMPVHYVPDWILLQTEFKRLLVSLPQIIRP